MRTDRVNISQTLSAIEKGADGYLLMSLDEG